MRVSDGKKLGMLLACLVLAATAMAKPVRLQLAGSGLVRVAWVREGEVELASAALPGQVEVGPGRGCLVFVPAGQPVRWRELVLPSESASVPQLLDQQQGSRLTGVVRTRDLRAFPPNVEISPVDRVIPELCRRGIEGLEVWRSQVDAHGSFELGPLLPGRWRLAMSAPFHRRLTRDITIGGTARAVDVGTVELQPVTVLGVRVESEWEDPPFELKVGKGERKSDLDPWKFSEVKQVELVGKETDLELDPGTYRFNLGKPGTQVGLAVEVELLPGEQELVLRPVPFTVEGRVVRGDRGVAGARLVVVRRGDPLELVTGSTGGFSLPLWAPDMYLVEVQPPEGTPEAILLDARDGKAGEVIERDLVLAKHLLSGVVVGAPHSAPVPGAEVAVKQEGGGRLFASTYKAGDDGAFSAYLKGGMKVEVSVSARGYMPRTLSIGEEPPSSPLVVSLERGVEVTGRVVGPDGSPLPGAWVLGSPGSPQGEATCSAQTGADGGFTVSCPTGTILFGAASGFTLGWVPAKEGEVLLRLGALQPITLVEIKAPDGHPAENAAITVQTQDGLWVPFEVMFRALALAGLPARAGSDGVLAVPVLPPGTYMMHLVMRSGTMPLGVVIFPALGPLSFKLPPRPSP